ncbi:uncharacterized protein CIMG_12560 [Coccidioides immitis RS]|uniref:Uncharacterized protein n=1 Tax=Coccidioides immitis (strain RS) TaxID=246410 RepID=J3K096_COCIM|nr:uncharacterized protein CIMG_12560 [Coccidioides immitis RS]EAS27247.3 hypothetical protein CIMG_12560 [Coccidioides immitis RS]
MSSWQFCTDYNRRSLSVQLSTAAVYISDTMHVFPAFSPGFLDQNSLQDPFSSVLAQEMSDCCWAEAESKTVRIELLLEDSYFRSAVSLPQQEPECVTQAEIGLKMAAQLAGMHTNSQQKDCWIGGHYYRNRMLTLFNGKPGINITGN